MWPHCPRPKIEPWLASLTTLSQTSFKPLYDTSSFFVIQRFSITLSYSLSLLDCLLLSLLWTMYDTTTGQLGSATIDTLAQFENLPCPGYSRGYLVGDITLGQTIFMATSDFTCGHPASSGVVTLCRSINFPIFSFRWTT